METPLCNSLKIRYYRKWGKSVLILNVCNGNYNNNNNNNDDDDNNNNIITNNKNNSYIKRNSTGSSNSIRITTMINKNNKINNKIVVYLYSCQQRRADKNDILI